MTTVELQEQRTKLIHDARAILDAADKEARDLTPDENGKVDEMFAEADRLEDKINTASKREALEREEARLKDVKERRTHANRLARVEEPADTERALRCWALANRGVRINGGDIENAQRCGIDLTAREITIKAPSKRAMSTTSSTAGSKAVEWKEFFGSYYEELKYFGPVLDLISFHDSDAGVDLPIPVVDDTANKAAILAEAAEVTAADPTISSVILKAFKYESKEVPVSLELLQDASFDLEGYIRTALATRFGRAWNEHITTGAGTTQPFGLVTRAGNSGVVAGGTAAAPAFTDADKLIDLMDSIDDAYRNRPGVGFMMSRATASKLRKLKDENKQYLWQPSLQAGQPATLFGHPVYVNPDMPSAGSNARIVLFGDYRQYLWRRVMGIELYRLDEIRIRHGQVVFLGFARGDGNLILPSAVKYLAAPAAE